MMLQYLFPAAQTQLVQAKSILRYAIKLYDDDK